MPRTPIRKALLASALVAPLLAIGVLASPVATKAKTQERLPQAESARSVQMAALDVQGPQGGPPGFPPPEGGPRAEGRPSGRPRPPGGPLALARNLAAAEVALGIRAAQLDAWRDFTDALQAMLPPPDLPPGPPPAPGAEGAPPRPEAFALTSAFASHVEAAGKAGTRLSQAVTALKARLSPEQLERMVRLEPTLLPPPPPPPGPMGAPCPQQDHCLPPR